jgi:carbamate kinase
VRAHYKLVIVHGNGPQVGNILIQAEEASTKIPPQSLDIAGAQTEGSIGFMLQQAIRNRLETIGLDGDVTTVLTEVQVDANDGAFKRPTKPIGPFFTRYRAEALERDLGWTMREDSGRGWRHVVPSPRPLHILNVKTIARMLDTASVVIAAGGGGIPVVRGRDGQWRGIEAVIDKDRAAALLASELDADVFMILTNVAQVSIDFGKPAQRPLDRLTAAEAEKYLGEGQFPPGSMGPKIEAAIQFVRTSGKTVLITDVEHVRDAIAGNGGTTITP